MLARRAASTPYWAKIASSLMTGHHTGSVPFTV